MRDRKSGGRLPEKVAEEGCNNKVGIDGLLKFVYMSVNVIQSNAHLTMRAQTYTRMKRERYSTQREGNRNCGGQAPPPHIHYCCCPQSHPVYAAN